MPEDEQAIRAEPIWSNKLIKWNIPASQKQMWIGAGVRYIGDVCHTNEGRLPSQSEINSKFSLKSSFLDALGLGLASSLSDEWQ